MSKFADRPRGFVPSSTPARPNVDMGGDKHGWYADAVKVANDRVKQIASSKHAYERGIRPYQRLGLVRNRGAIVPFGVNSVGGQFVDKPSAYGGSGELRGGIMFTKAGQDYLQDLLNKRQKQYAEMYGDSQSRQIETSYTDPQLGDGELSVIQPLYNDLLDDLRIFKIKGIEESYKKWWAVFLTALPTFGANFRPEINTIYETLSELLDGYISHYEASGLSGKDFTSFQSVTARLERSLNVIYAYIGDTGTISANNAPINGSSPESRQKVVNALVKQYGATLSNELMARARRVLSQGLEEVSLNDLQADGTVFHMANRFGDEGESRVRDLNAGDLEPYDADGEFRPRTGRLEERPVLSAVGSLASGEQAPRSQGALAQELRDAGIGRGDAQSLATQQSRQVRRPVPATPVEGEGRPRHNFRRKPTVMATHHRLLNARNER